MASQWPQIMLAASVGVSAHYFGCMNVFHRGRETIWEEG